MSKSLVKQYEDDPIAAWRSIQSSMQEHEECEVRDLAVATMERVRRNAEMLAERLTEMGWEPLSGRMITDSGLTDVEAALRSIEEFEISPIPIALHVFWEVVGSLDFVWNYQSESTFPNLFKGVDLFDLDPLYVDGADFVSYSTGSWRDMIDEGYLSSEGPLDLALAPDNYHKANISGGSPYGITLPDTSVDPLFKGDGFEIRFTDYLRKSFQYGGFPGLEKLDLSDSHNATIAKLTEGFEVF